MINNLPSIIVALGGFVVIWRKVEQLHETTNSKMDQLLKVTGESEYAKGVKKGEQSTKP